MVRRLADSWAAAPTVPVCPPPKAGRCKWNRWMPNNHRLAAVRRTARDKEESAMNDSEMARHNDPQNAGSLPHLPGELEPDQIPAWELIDTGRYMPRRIRGSFRGREL